MNINIKKAYVDLINGKKRNVLFLILRFILHALSHIYLWIIRVLRFIRIKRQVKYKTPLVSVGNVTWGGTGKTPLVIEIAEYLKNKNATVAIVHHGGTYQDEVSMVADRLNNVLVVYGKTKRASVEKATAAADIVILDDGYQQWGIKKDVEVLCLNCKLPFGNGFLIPRGSLREEISSISRADVIVLNKADDCPEKDALVKEIRRYNHQAPLVFSRYKATEVIDIIEGTVIRTEDLNNMRCAVLTAVADPDSVINTVHSLGLDVRQKFLYPDHHVFSRQDIHRVGKELDEEIKAVFITEKDYAKVKNDIGFLKEVFSENRVLLIKVKLEIFKNAQALFGRLDFLLGCISG